ncbi:MAG TPA: hypothetical protein VF781_00220 [Solirubrobacteraceae bacterium]
MADNGQTPFSELFPPLPQGFQEPFWYASLQSFWLYYRVEPDLLAQHLPELPERARLEVARFDFGGGEQAGLVSLDFQRYTGHGPSYLETANEVEFNLYAYPRAREPDVPLMSWQQYLLGEEQTKTIGGYRLHVPCDNPIAVKAGQGLYGEPKYLAAFECSVPCLNGPPSPPSTAWSYQVYAVPAAAAASTPEGQGPLIYGLQCDLDGLRSVPANQSPLIEYGVLTSSPGAPHLVGNHWDFYGPFHTYFGGQNPPLRAEITLGTEVDPTGTIADLKALVGNTQPLAAQVYTSPPVSAESRGWYPVPSR